MKLFGEQPAATVILLHAAVVGRWSLNVFGRRLARLGFRVHNPGYPNRRLDLSGCAEYLVPILTRLAAESRPGAVHLAGHSLGGLVARRLLALYQPPNFGRLVTLGTPHLGSPLADCLHQAKIYQKIFGPIGRELTTGRPLDWPGPWPPPYGIGLIAGTIPFGPGTLSLPRDSDGTVTRPSAQPAGGAGYASVPATHTTIPLLKKTALLTAGFLVTGRFDVASQQTLL